MWHNLQQKPKLQQEVIDKIVDFLSSLVPVLNFHSNLVENSAKMNFEFKKLKILSLRNLIELVYLFQNVRKLTYSEIKLLPKQQFKIS